MDYSQGRQSGNIEQRGQWDIAQENIKNILNAIRNPSMQNFRQIDDAHRPIRNRQVIPYDPNNGIAVGPNSDIDGIPAQASQLAEQDALRVAPIAGDPPPSVLQGRENEALLNQMMPQTPPTPPYPQEIPPVDQLPPQNTPRLRGFQDLFQNIDPQQLDILKNIRGN